MARLTKIRCDSCAGEAETKDTGHWYTVYRNNAYEFDLAGDSDRFDFCSLPCIAAWSRSRELVRTAS